MASFNSWRSSTSKYYLIVYNIGISRFLSGIYLRLSHGGSIDTHSVREKTVVYIIERLTNNGFLTSSQRERQGTGSKKVNSYGVATFLDPDKTSPKSCLCRFWIPVKIKSRKLYQSYSSIE